MEFEAESPEVRLNEVAFARSGGPTLEESASFERGKGRMKIIAPGWGSSGYYPAEVLESYGPSVFQKGLHMYVDHPTASEDYERPERSVRDLAGVLESDAVWDANGPAGPGLYADIKVFSAFVPMMVEAADHIGVSIRASGTVSQGVREGREGLIIESITRAESVDFVTKAGAGGRIMELVESARAGVDVSESTMDSAYNILRRLERAVEERWPDSYAYVEDHGSNWVVARADSAWWLIEYSMDEQGTVTLSAEQNEVRREIEWIPTDSALEEAAINAQEAEIVTKEEFEERLSEALQRAEEAEAAAEAARTELAEAKSASIRSAAEKVVAEGASKADLPQAAVVRVSESLLAGELPVDEAGEFDAAAFATTVEEAFIAEANYLAEAAGAGTVRGVGETDSSEGEDLIESVAASYAALTNNPQIGESYIAYRKTA